MLLFKCLVAGLLAIVFVAILLLVAMIVFVLPRSGAGTTVGSDPVSIVRSRPILALIITSLSFAYGFLWEYMRAK